MSALVLINPKVTIATIDMSAFCTAVELPIDADEVETTNFGSSGWRTYIPGLKKGEVKVTFNDDFATTTVDDRLWSWFGTVQTFNVKATNAANSTTNPEYQMSVVVSKFNPVAGKVGQLANQDLTWKVTGVITRATV
jgi:hypothetical protein